MVLNWGKTQVGGPVVQLVELLPHRAETGFDLDL